MNELEAEIAEQDETLRTRVKVLDHGYVEVVEAWGSDRSIVESARMSTGKGFLGWGDEQKPGDEKLLKYLSDNHHDTPFEFAGMVLEVQAPIFVFREWHRHRVPFSYNEASARYSPLPDLNYIPTVARLMMNANGPNKQAGTAKDAEALDVEGAEFFRASLATLYAQNERVYQLALRRGVPKELARVHLPVGRYSKMRVSSNLRGWCNFLALREAANAQWEIRAYASVVNALLRARFPRAMQLFNARASSR